MNDYVMKIAICDDTPEELNKIAEMTAGIAEQEKIRCVLARYDSSKALLAAIPVIDITRRGKQIETIQGEVVSPIEPAPGCRFAPRCKYACDKCRSEQRLVDIGGGHFVACCCV